MILLEEHHNNMFNLRKERHMERMVGDAKRKEIYKAFGHVLPVEKDIIQFTGTTARRLVRTNENGRQGYVSSADRLQNELRMGNMFRCNQAVGIYQIEFESISWQPERFVQSGDFGIQSSYFDPSKGEEIKLRWSLPVQNHFSRLEGTYTRYAQDFDGNPVDNYRIVRSYIKDKVIDKKNDLR